MAELQTTETFKVQGCGVTLICTKGQSMLDWIAYIVERGGTPEVTRL